MIRRKLFPEYGFYIKNIPKESYKFLLKNWPPELDPFLSDQILTEKNWTAVEASKSFTAIDKTFNQMNPNEKVLSEEYHLARDFVNTRVMVGKYPNFENFPVWLDEEEDECVKLIPGWDMWNHSPG